jgi:hypothetical protein
MALVAAILMVPFAVQADEAMDHAALAAQYEQEAKDARAKAEAHKAMEKRYAAVQVSKTGQWIPGMQNHCRRLIAEYEDAADDAEELAKLHREAAAKH